LRSSLKRGKRIAIIVGFYLFYKTWELRDCSKKITLMQNYRTSKTKRSKRMRRIQMRKRRKKR